MILIEYVYEFTSYGRTRQQSCRGNYESLDAFWEEIEESTDPVTFPKVTITSIDGVPAQL